ncbi:MAG: hypothetical protein ACR2PZ_23425 [Pseudomonadales bacterium]
MSKEQYVHVREEPFHQRRYENAFVRTYDALIPPGAQSLYHLHNEDTFYVSIVEARQITEQTWGTSETITNERIPSGIAICRHHRDEPLIHQVTNGGDVPMRMIGAEIKACPEVWSANLFEGPGHTLLRDDKRYRAYRLCLEPGESTGEITYGFSGLTVFLSQCCIAYETALGTSRILTCEGGDTLWHDGPVACIITNVAETPLQAIVAEWTGGS